MSRSLDWATPADVSEIRSFLSSAYGRGSFQTVPGRFDWLCNAHPRGLHVAVAREAGRIVGGCCHLPVRVAIGGTEVEAAYGLDCIVDPARRGSGIGSDLLALRLNRFAASLSTGQAPAMAGLYAKAGGRDCGPVLHALRVRRPAAPAGPRALARDVIAWGLGVARGGRGGARRLLSVNEAATLLSTLGPRLSSDEAGPCRDAADFAWRYGGPVYADHTCWEVTANRRHGMVVTRREGDAEIVVDVFANPDDLPVVLRATACTSAASRLNADLHGSRPAAAFTAAGWLVRPRNARFVVLANEPALLRELARRPWAFFAGESDLDLLRYPAAPGGRRREL